MIWPVAEEPTNTSEDKTLVKSIKNNAKLYQKDKSVCRKSIRILYDNLKYPGKKFFNDDAEKIAMINFVKTCSKQHTFKLPEIQNQLAILQRTKQANGGLAESNEKHNLDKLINEQLSSLKEEKNKNLIKEGEQIKDRLTKINFNDPNAFNLVLNEIKTMRTMKFNEDLINLQLENVLDSLGTGMWQSLKQKGAEYILSKLGVTTNDFFGLTLTNFFANVDLIDYKKVFTDCKFTAEKLTQSIVEAMVQQFANKKGFDGALSSIFLQTMAEQLMNKTFFDEAEKKVYDWICPKLSSITSSLF